MGTNPSHDPNAEPDAPRQPRAAGVPSTGGTVVDHNQPDEPLHPVHELAAGRGATPPTIGRIVVFQAGHSDDVQYELPAVVTATTKSLHPAGVEAGDVEPLDSAYHVHLAVLSPGNDTPVFQAFNVPWGEGTRGTWNWPERV